MLNVTFLGTKENGGSTFSIWADFICPFLKFKGPFLKLGFHGSQVLSEMLDMLRDHQNNYHTARLEWIVIWLIVVEVVVGLFECASILGWVGHE